MASMGMLRLRCRRSDAEAKRLLEFDVPDAGIKQAVVGNRLSDISHEVQT